MGLLSSNGSANEPLWTLTNTANDATGPKIRFILDKGAAGADDDVAGTVEFYADDDNQDNILFAKIEGYVVDASNGAEGGGMKLYVATHDGEAQPGLTLVDGSAEDEVDATIGNGTSSVVTVAGDLKVTTDIILDDGGSLKEASGTAAITFDGSGHVTKIGQDSPSSGQFLKWDGSKAVWDAATASSLACDDLSAGDAAVTVSTTSGNITIDAQANDADVIIKVDDAGSSVTAVTFDGSDEGNAVFVNDLKLSSDAAAIHWGADNEVTLTHVADKGLTLKHTATADDKPVILTLATGETDMAADDVIGTINFQAPDEGTGTDAVLVCAGIEAVSEGDFSSSSNATKLSFKTGASEAAAEKVAISSGGDLSIVTDGASIFFGADSEIELRHVADDGLILKHVGTGDGKEPSLTFQAGDNDIAADDVLGSIFFQAPDEGAGTDAVLVAAGIEAVSEGDFSSSSNATSLVFKTGASEAAAAKVKITSGGHLVPATDDTHDLGTSSLRWQNIYTTDLHLNNSRGNWTIVEEEDMLTIRNNKTGKWYKMGMTEIDPTGRDDGMASPPPALP